MSTGFRISARALRQLGAELITSDNIALNELIKNAFDAGSKSVRISFTYPFALSKRGLLTRCQLSVNQDQSLATHVTGSLNGDVSKEMSQKINTVAVELESLDRKEAIDRLYDSFCKIEISDTGVGMSVANLNDAFLVIGTPTKWVQKKNTQTELVLGEKGIGRLSMMRLGTHSKVVSGKAGEIHWHSIDFDWLKFDDPNLFLQDIEIPLNKREASKNVDESGTTITISGLSDHWDKDKIKDFTNGYLRRIQNPFNRSKRYPVTVLFNQQNVNITRLAKWFIDCANFRAKINFTPLFDLRNDSATILTREITWHRSTTSEKFTWSRKDLVAKLGCSQEDLSELGAFSLDVLWFNRGLYRVNPAGADYSYTDVRRELDVWAGGYAIYRDGFRIGVTGSMEDDWLKMDKGALKSQGFTFNRYQAVAAVSIGSNENPMLIDSANREGLIDVPAFKLLTEIVRDVVNKDLKSQIEVVLDNESKNLVAENASIVAVESLEDRVLGVIKKVGVMKKTAPSNMKSVIDEVSLSLKVVEAGTRRLAKEVVLNRESRVEMLELAGMGLVLDKVAHELNRLTHQIEVQLTKLEREEDYSSFPEIIKVIGSQLTATNKRLKTIDRLSPSARMRKGKFSLSGLIKTLLEGYEGRFERHQIDGEFTINGEVSDKEVMVTMVRGLVPQIIENLLDNSMYWIAFSLEKGSKKGKISIDIDTQDKVLRYSDNGAGIDPKDLEQIMRPYFTMKKDGKGLGLYISQELADHHGVSFYLDESDVSADGRLRSFVLELVM